MRRRHVLVDLSRCSSIDAEMVGKLLHGQAATMDAGGRFALIIPMSSSPVARVAWVMSLVDMFAVYSSVEHAMASAGVLAHATAGNGASSS